MHAEETFADWACSPLRTLEERFGAQLLIETFTGLPIPKDENWSRNYEAERLCRKERAMNPAYQPEYTREQAERAQTGLPELKKLDGAYDDREVRDVSFLRFCPGLEELHLKNTAARDWSALGELKEMKTLWLTDQVVQDLRCIGSLTKLETLRLYLHCPWPDLSGWDRLENLREFHFHGNPLALQAIGSLPAVRKASIDHWLKYTVPVRSLHNLPDMPALTWLHLINTWQLAGIERYPLLINAEIYGYFDDLQPLAMMQNLTHLLLSGGEYETLAPIARMGNLHRLTVRNEQPHDYSVLCDMPRLHEVQVELCPASRMEVGSLNAGLSPWSDLFGVEPPRALPPLRLISDKTEDPTCEARDFGGDEEMHKSEARWFAREINHRLTRLLGKGWGHVHVRFAHGGGHENISISRPEDIDQLHDIVETLRGLIASCRHLWRCHLIVDSLARYERDMQGISDEDDDEEETFDAERERQDFEDRQQRIRERQAFLERKHRLRLQQESGLPIQPEEFAMPRPEEDEPEETYAGDMDAAAPEYDLGTEMNFLLTILQRGCFVHERDQGLVEMLLDLKMEEEPGPEEA